MNPTTCEVLDEVERRWGREVRKLVGLYLVKGYKPEQIGIDADEVRINEV